MRLIVIPDEEGSRDGAGAAVLEHALTVHPLATLTMEAVRNVTYRGDDPARISRHVTPAESGEIVWVVPERWSIPLKAGMGRVVQAQAGVAIDRELLTKARQPPWLMVSHGRFAAQVNGSLLDRVLAETDADVVAVEATAELQANQERIRLTAQGEVVGCRRSYRDVVEPAPVPADWPHHLLIRAGRAEDVLREPLPHQFGDFAARCRVLGLRVRCFRLAGTAFDLARPDGLLAMTKCLLIVVPRPRSVTRLLRGESFGDLDGHAEISPQSRLVGPVLIGDHVRVEAGAVVVGPAVLCDHSTVGSGAVVDASVVGRQVTVGPQCRVADTCLMTPCGTPDRKTDGAMGSASSVAHIVSPDRRGAFRTWPGLSYARCFKRVADFIVAVIVLGLFAPIMPIIALAIKVNSRGPVFYRDRRQGLHGRPFKCIKFRTMKVGAAEIQDKLRFVSEVDGPQFKISDDPRISSVGHFLRETCIDEIPQFFNVLLGQMSVVGPRPSPEAENTQCPSWRDARLSVRPGITGLWQVHRTRQPLRDFQEWIYYDTRYVRELSLRNDLWICVKTFVRLVNIFVDQF